VSNCSFETDLRRRVLQSTLLMLAAVMSLPAQWSTNVNVNNGICSAIGDQLNPVIVSDGSGGAIITWVDYRSPSSSTDIYAQRINATGTVQWTSNGVGICGETGNQGDPTIISDGSGGAIIAWQDFRSGSTWDIYAQRINASGAAQWASGGVAICTASGNQQNPSIATDDSGGAIMTWYDLRSGTTTDIYAQRINAAGTVQWTSDGVAICAAAGGNQSNPAIVSDDSGGAVIAWGGTRGSTWDIYAQRINASGTVQWAANGVEICTAMNNQLDPMIVGDGSSGAIMTWHDERTLEGIYAQRISASGIVQWNADGFPICAATSNQAEPMIASDGSGGAIITWYDYRNLFGPDIYAQSINASGVAQWTANGIAICTAAGDQFSPTIASDGSGGAIMTWYDSRSGTSNDVYAQRVNAAGAVQWTANGAAVSTATGFQLSPTIISNGAGGAIITWMDNRASGVSAYDIFASNIGSNGVLPVELTTLGASSRQNTVELQWSTATEVNNYGFEVERRLIGEISVRWSTIGFVAGAGTSSSPLEYSFIDRQVSPGRYAYRIMQIDKDGSFKYTGEVEVEVGLAPKEFNLVQNYPNPFNPSTTIEFTVPEEGKASLKIYDVLGREVATLFDGEVAGSYRQAIFDATRFAAGIYIARLKHFPAGSLAGGEKQLLRKMLLVK
jgi:hypothetical protein